MTTIRVRGGKDIQLAEYGGQNNGNPFASGWARWIATTAAYESIYKHSPAVRAVVDFLARNCAMVTLGLFERQEAGDAVEILDDPVAAALRRPNARSSRYAWLRDTFSDKFVYGFGLSLIAQSSSETGQTWALARVPPSYVSITGSSLAKPEEIVVQADGQRRTIQPNSRLYVHGYAPDKTGEGHPPLETLRRLIDEESAATETRRRLWEQGAAIGGVLQRPRSAPKWSKDAKERFLLDWATRFAGPANAGKTPVLEDDMTFTPASFSPEQAQYVEARKLTREDVARAFQLPLTLAGLVDTPLANVKEYRQMLYMDVLGPELVEFAEELTLQFVQGAAGYGEEFFAGFDMLAKLRASFEEQASVGVSAVGRPYMTPNEWRDRVGLPRLEDPSADRLTIPLAVMLSGPEGGVEDGEVVADVTPPSLTGAEGGAAALPSHGAKARKQADRLAVLRDRHARRYERAMASYFERQSKAVGSDPARISSRRWDRELAADLAPLHTGTVTAHAQFAADAIGGDFDPAFVENYIATATANDARGINMTTAERVAAMVEQDVPFDEAYATETSYRTALLAVSFATRYGMFGANEGAQQAGATQKTWHVTNPNSRHPDLDGETVGADEEFSNGAQYPGDPAAGDDESAGCQCVVEYTTRGG